MGKKKKMGENSKKSQGRDRKKEHQREKERQRQAEIQKKIDQEWDKGTDKRAQKRMEQARLKQEEKERKRLEKLAAKQKDEMDLASMKKSRRDKGGKVAVRRTLKVEMISEELKEIESVEARNVTDAIAILSMDKPEAQKLDRHPERRQKAKYKAFEEKRLPQLMQQNPGLRRTQLKQLLRKEWKKSSENPMNQDSLPFNFPSQKKKKKKKKNDK